MAATRGMYSMTPYALCFTGESKLFFLPSAAANTTILGFVHSKEEWRYHEAIPRGAREGMAA
jgi:hypothetical protein